MILLHLESSTHYCSVALSEDEQCIFFRVNDEGKNHAALMSLFIRDALDFLQQKKQVIDGVAVSSGPGSYTGLRIGVSTAKGLCYGLNIPLISISTLEIMTIAALKVVDNSSNALFVPMIDARRMEVYSAIFDETGELAKDVHAEILDDKSYASEIQNHQVYFFGNGAVKFRSVVNSGNAHFIDNIHPLANNMILPAVRKWNLQQWEDVAYFEPFYLKEFYTTFQIK